MLWISGGAMSAMLPFHFEINSDGVCTFTEVSRYEIGLFFFIFLNLVTVVYTVGSYFNFHAKDKRNGEKTEEF